jgi:hypothetical protein
VYLPWARVVLIGNLSLMQLANLGEAHGNSSGSLIEIPHPVRAVAGR